MLAFLPWRYYLVGKEVEMPRITSKGQVTVPKEIRDEFGLGPGTEVQFTVEGHTIKLVKPRGEEPLARWKGALKLPCSVDEFIGALRGPK
jgi:antitoxin PrlF